MALTANTRVEVGYRSKYETHVETTSVLVEKNEFCLENAVSEVLFKLQELGTDPEYVDVCFVRELPKEERDKY